MGPYNSDDDDDDDDDARVSAQPRGRHQKSISGKVHSSNREMFQQIMFAFVIY
jgi:hypothetical protein